jgi:hypothetical protein
MTEVSTVPDQKQQNLVSSVLVQHIPNTSTGQQKILRIQHVALNSQTLSCRSRMQLGKFT